MSAHLTSHLVDCEILAWDIESRVEHRVARVFFSLFDYFIVPTISSETSVFIRSLYSGICSAFVLFSKVRPYLFLLRFLSLRFQNSASVGLKTDDVWKEEVRLAKSSGNDGCVKEPRWITKGSTLWFKFVKDIQSKSRKISQQKLGWLLVNPELARSHRNGQDLENNARSRYQHVHSP